MTKVYDLFMFSGENELLEIRLNELNDVIDFFVIGSCEHSHSGIKKGLNHIPHELCLKFGYKIIYYEIPYIPNPDPWYNEHYGRQYLYEKIKPKLNDGDILLICDLDEIPKPEIVVEQSKKLIQPISFLGEYYYFCFDLWGRKSIDGYLTKPEWVDQTNLNWMRSNRTNYKHNYFKHIPYSSFHYSTVATPQNILNKMKYFGHANECPKDVLDLDWIEQCIKEKRGSISRESKLDELKLVILTKDNCPKYLFNNQEKFKHLFYKNYIQ